MAQLSSCVHWQESIEYMIGAGVTTFIEIGPGQVLNGLIRRIDQGAQILNVEDADSIGVISV